VEYTERVYDLNTFEFEERTFRFQADWFFATNFTDAHWFFLGLIYLS
jgi:hypothetical protein